jgi:hypothetical protein
MTRSGKNPLQRVVWSCQMQPGGDRSHEMLALSRECAAAFDLHQSGVWSWRAA